MRELLFVKRFGWELWVGWRYETPLPWYLRLGHEGEFEWKRLVVQWATPWWETARNA